MKSENAYIEKMLGYSRELVPRNELKDEILKKVLPYVPTERKKQAVRSRPMYRRLMPLAACLLILFLMTGACFGLYYEDYETVYLDVNPSVALTLNRFETVNRVTYLNTDAEESLSGIKLMGMKADEALSDVIDAYDENGYFTDAELYISVFSEKNKNCEKLTEKLVAKAEQVKNGRGYSVNSGGINKDDKEAANGSGVSPMKYKIIMEILAREGNTYTFEELKNMKMSELRKLLG